MNMFNISSVDVVKEVKQVKWGEDVTSFII